MALNPKILKSLASYSDEAADALAFATNFGDDAARLASKYGDDILRVAPKTERLPFKPSSTQLAERAKANIAKRQMSRRVPSTKDTKAGDALSELFDTFTSDTSLKGVSEDLLDTPYTDKFGNAVMVDSAFPELWSYRKNPQMQVIEDSVKRRHLDPPNWAMHFDSDMGREFPVRIDHSFDDFVPSVDDVEFFQRMSAPIPASAYRFDNPSPTVGTNTFSSWDYDFVPPTVRKTDFGGHNPQFEDSLYFPDGFASPDDFARYYDALELGYVPQKFGYDSRNEFFSDNIDTNDWNDFWDAYYGEGAYADETPLKTFFDAQFKSPRRFTKQSPSSRIEEFFSNAMFQDDSWIK